MKNQQNPIRREVQIIDTGVVFPETILDNYNNNINKKEDKKDTEDKENAT